MQTSSILFQQWGWDGLGHEMFLCPKGQDLIDILVYVKDYTDRHAIYCLSFPLGVLHARNPCKILYSFFHHESWDGGPEKIVSATTHRFHSTHPHSPAQPQSLRSEHLDLTAVTTMMHSAALEVLPDHRPHLPRQEAPQLRASITNTCPFSYHLV